MHTGELHSTSEYVHDEPWLDFLTCQSGHAHDSPNWSFIAADCARTPTRPCMDAEPGYEDTLRNLEGGYPDDWDARKALYWALFAGAHGHTYVYNPVWQIWRPGREQLIRPRRPWYEAIRLPGSSQIQHARALLSRPFLRRIPDQALVASDIGAGTHYVRATRDSEGSYALIYPPAGDPLEVDLANLTGEKLPAGGSIPVRVLLALPVSCASRSARLSRRRKAGLTGF